jgi:hypothetical protein
VSSRPVLPTTRRARCHSDRPEILMHRHFTPTTSRPSTGRNGPRPGSAGQTQRLRALGYTGPHGLTPEVIAALRGVLGRARGSRR